MPPANVHAYQLYIADRSKTCLYRRSWLTSATSKGANRDDFVTLYGLIFQMKLFATAADPTKPLGTGPQCKPDGVRPTAIGEGTSFRSMSTNTYQLSLLEVPTGLKLLLITSPSARGARDLLKALHRDLFVPLVIKDVSYVPGEPIKSSRFDAGIDHFLKSNGLLQ